MKLKFVFSLFMAGASLGVLAQTHQEGVEYYKADQFNNALELLERNYNNPGTDKAAANYYLGLLSIRQQDLSGAKKYFEQGVSINPDYAYNYIGLGSLELKNGNVKEAENNFKKAEKLNKKDAAVWVAIARAYYESSSEGATIYEKQIANALKNARRRNMYEPEIFIYEGDVAYDQDDRNSAASKYEMATTYNPQAADAYVKYAKLYTKFNPDFAISMLKKLLENNPNSALGQRELAEAYYNKEDYKNAAEQYSKYINNPSHFKSDENRYLLLLFHGGKYQEGYDYSTKLVAEDPDNFTARRFQLMNAAQLESMKDKVLELAENVYRIHMADPKNNAIAIVDYRLISAELRAAERYDEAKEVLNEAITEFPENTDFYLQLAYIPLEQNKYDEAADAYMLYISKNDKASYNDLIQTALLCYYAGVLNKDETQKAKATEYVRNSIVYAEKAAAANPDSYRPYKVLGDAKVYLASDADKATAGKADYEKALSLIDAEKYASDFAGIQKALGVK